MQAAPLCNLERGRHAPSLRTLCRIADALGVTVNDILYPAGYVVTAPSSADADEAAYAGLQRLGVARATRLPGEVADLGPGRIAAIEARVSDFLALEDLCGVCKRAAIPLQAPFTPDAAGAEQLAYLVRTHCGIGSAVVFDYIELLENQGLRVLFLPLPPAVESLSFYDTLNANAFLILADGFNPEKQLFRLAVELANLYLFTANDCSPVEETPLTRRFAKQFAALFLMPREALRATVNQLGLGPADWSYELLLRIKHRFGVSAEAFAHRLEEIGALHPTLRQEFKARIQAHYASTQYAEPDSSRRVLSRNGRFGDLLLCAQRLDPAPDELAAIAARTEGGGALATPAFREHP